MTRRGLPGVSHCWTAPFTLCECMDCGEVRPFFQSTRRPAAPLSHQLAPHAHPKARGLPEGNRGGMWDRNVLWKSMLVLCHHNGPSSAQVTGTGLPWRTCTPQLPLSARTSELGRTEYFVFLTLHFVLHLWLLCLPLSIAPEMLVKGSIQTIYDQYIAAVYNTCLFSFSLLYVPHPT